MKSKQPKIYDTNGNLTSKAAFQAAKKIGEITDRLYASLLRQGMSIVEGRALETHLQGQINVSAILALMKAQCKKYEGSKQTGQRGQKHGNRKARGA